MLRFITWDLLFPWIGPLVSLLLVQVAGQNRDGLEVLAVIVLPIGLCLIRAKIGIRSLSPAGSAGMSTLVLGCYQCLFALALVLLMLLEMFSTMLSFADDEPLWAWAIPLVLWSLYWAIMLAVERIHARATALSDTPQTPEVSPPSP